MIGKNQLENWFSHHAPEVAALDPENPGQIIKVPDTHKIAKYKRLREAGYAMALTILECTPACPDQSAAIRKVREAVWSAIASVACDGK